MIDLSTPAKIHEARNVAIRDLKHSLATWSDLHSTADDARRKATKAADDCDVTLMLDWAATERRLRDHAECCWIDAKTLAGRLSQAGCLAIAATEMRAAKRMGKIFAWLEMDEPDGIE